uniref:Uncharacterized protein n=1 Tax=Arundo donax TaxID=35708 RepID=A0A0A9GWK2_ARUDO
MLVFLMMQTMSDDVGSKYIVFLFLFDLK